MKITKNFLKKQNACEYGNVWFCDQKETELIPLLKKLMNKKIQSQIRNEYSDNSLDWANWLIVRKMKYKQYVSYGIYAAEQVIDIFEERYPNNKVPRMQIEAAKKCIKNPSKKNKESAYAAVADYRYSPAAGAARAAGGADYDYAYAAAAFASYIFSGYAYTSYTADDVSYASAYIIARDKMKKKILKYGIKLLL